MLSMQIYIDLPALIRSPNHLATNKTAINGNEYVIQNIFLYSIRYK